MQKRRLQLFAWWCPAPTVNRSDECYFTSAKILKRHNTRHWSPEYQNLLFKRAQQGRFAVVGLMFLFWKSVFYRIFEGGLTACQYRVILEEVIPGLIENVSLALYIAGYFQQDSVPSHNFDFLMQFLSYNFP